VKKETCPICLGCGVEEIKDSEYTYYNKKCHNCEGKGYVCIILKDKDNHPLKEGLNLKEAKK
jgi:DnaJ-class molecular chaperone